MSQATSPCREMCDPVLEAGCEVVAHRLGRSARVVKCRSCGYRAFDPIPNLELLEEYYGGQYWSPDQLESTAASFYAVDFVGHVREFRRIADAYGAPLAGGRWHEVGCSFGAVVMAMRKAGFEATGSDLSRGAVSAGAARGNAWIETTPLKDWLAAHPQPVDMFFMSHSLEHIPDPAAELRLMRDALSPNGAIVVRVPNGLYPPAARRHMSVFHWFQFPDHIHYFTPRSLSCVFKSAGLKLVEVTALARDDTPDVLADLLFGRAWAEMPDASALWSGLAANLLTCELQAVAVRDDAPVRPHPNVGRALSILGDETLRPVEPVTPPANAASFSVQADAGAEWSYSTGAEPGRADRPMTYDAAAAAWVDRSDGAVVMASGVRVGATAWTRACRRTHRAGLARLTLETFGYESAQAPFLACIAVNGASVAAAQHRTGRTDVLECYVRLPENAEVCFCFRRASAEGPGLLRWFAGVIPIEPVEVAS